jgi:hypothetical protein
MWANGRIRPEIAHLRAKQTLFTRAAVPVDIAFDPVFAKYLRTRHGVYVYRIPACGVMVADSVCVDV